MNITFFRLTSAQIDELVSNLMLINQLCSREVFTEISIDLQIVNDPSNILRTYPDTGLIWVAQN